MSPAAFHEFLPVIKYVLETKVFGLKLEPSGNTSKPYKIMCFNKNNYADDPFSIRSVSGFILNVLGVQFRCTSFLVIKSAEKRDVIKLRNGEGSLVKGCKGSYACDPIVEKHEDFS